MMMQSDKKVKVKRNVAVYIESEFVRRRAESVGAESVKRDRNGTEDN